MKLNLFSRTKTTDLQKPIALNNDSGVQFSLRMSGSSEEDKDYSKIDISEASGRNEYRTQYLYWKKETIVLSHVDMYNSHFRAISFNESLYMPFILEDLKNEDESIVQLLELLMPDKISYPGYISKKQAMRKWLRILQLQNTI